MRVDFFIIKQSICTYTYPLTLIIVVWECVRLPNSILSYWRLFFSPPQTHIKRTYTFRSSAKRRGGESELPSCKNIHIRLFTCCNYLIIHSDIHILISLCVDFTQTTNVVCVCVCVFIRPRQTSSNRRLPFAIRVVFIIVSAYFIVRLSFFVSFSLVCVPSIWCSNSSNKTSILISPSACSMLFGWVLR